MPHPRINPAIKGDYIKIDGYAHPTDKAMKNWIKLTDIQKTTTTTNADGSKNIRIKFKDGRADHVHNSQFVDIVKQNLGKRGITNDNQEQ